MTEYVIWGVAPGMQEEQLLVANLYNRPITNLSEAETLVTWCKKQGCADVRIQSVDLSTKADFFGCIAHK